MDHELAKDWRHVLQRTSGLWDELRGQRIFITGGTGFFGQWLLESFCHACDELALDATAVVLTRNPARVAKEMPYIAQHRQIVLHPGDFQAFEFPAGHFHCVIHAATETDSYSAPIDRGLLYDANVNGTRRTLEFSERAGVERYLYVSSGAVYGRQPLDVSHIAEDSSASPDTMDIGAAYGHSKRASEFLCAVHAARSGQIVTTARCFAFVGPHLPLDINFAIGNFIRDALRGGPIRVNGDGAPLRSYLYMADLAVWLWTILLRGKSALTYNVGSDHAVSIAELARLVSEVVNPRAEVVIAQTPIAGRPPARYVPSIERARTTLGLDTWIDLATAVERTADWYRPRVR